QRSRAGDPCLATEESRDVIHGFGLAWKIAFGCRASASASLAANRPRRLLAFVFVIEVPVADFASTPARASMATVGRSGPCRGAAAEVLHEGLRHLFEKPRGNAHF